jgi:hypothetical protein
VSSFIGFAPADDPRVAIAVMVDEPQGGHLGGAVAAPVFKQIAEQALHYLHVPPSPSLLARKPTVPAAKPGAAKPAVAEADEDERPGSDVPEVRDADVNNGDPDENTVATADRPASDGDDDAAADDGEDGEAPELPRTVTVPNFQGMTIAAVLRAAHQNGVELAFDARTPPTGVAFRQAPAPGPARRGVVCTVAFGRRE